MIFNETPLKGAYIIDLEPFEDHRGLFSRLFCKEAFLKIGLEREIVQINFSRTSNCHAIRGLHYQLPPFAETKILKCIRGRILDVIVDIRKGSPTFLQHFRIELTERNQQMIFVPEGFAHGFQTLEPDSEVIYFVTAAYSPQYECGIRHDDPMLGINWPAAVSDISDKDKSHPLLTPNFKGIL